MILNGLERKVYGVEPTHMFSGVYNTPVSYPREFSSLNIVAWLEDLKKINLVHSGVIHEAQYGFNDTKILGIDEAERAKREGISNVWIGLLEERIVNLEVLPVIFLNLKAESHYQYAQKILGRVVTFVESPKNYKQRKI